jgi:hypothetical protein
VAAASRPPLYHGLLALPDSLKGLEALLHIDIKADVSQDRAARAGFTDSGVSANPRIIERHRISDGACWLSHDFGSSIGQKNFYSHPLDFEPDGGEVIFNLPNGLQAYLLVDAQGRRIDTAPTKIVKDPETTDGAVTNGISCMRCHAGGIIPKRDEVRRSVLANSRAFSDQLENITAVYIEPEPMARLMEEDRERFLSALRNLGITRFSAAGEPIHNIARRFTEPLDINLASAELGLPADKLKQELEQRVNLQRSIGQLSVEGGTIPRDAFQQAFGATVDTIRTGRFRPPSQQLAASTIIGLTSSPAAVESPSPFAPLYRFYNKGANAHTYGYREDELARWRKLDVMQEQAVIGYIATQPLPGTVRLWRAYRRRGDKHYFYLEATRSLPKDVTVEAEQIHMYVWTRPGAGRTPIYASTWTDGTDVFLDPTKENADRYIEDSKKALGVNRPYLGVMFYIYGAKPPATPSAAEP